MLYYRYWVVILTCVVGLSTLFWISKQYAQEETLDWRTELKQIDDEIDRSKDLKRKYESAAARADDQGRQWQFQQNQKQEAKRAFERGDANRQAAQKMQAHIDELNARRAQILQEHPEANVERSS